MVHPYEVNVDNLNIKFSTGCLAKQANGAVIVSLGNTNVFCSATMSLYTKEDQNFFPLTVDYREKFWAAGRFPGGYFKREGRPSEKEILTSRLCDRPLRILFPKNFVNEVQVCGMLLSTDLSNDPDILMVNAASASLVISDIPFNGPLGCVRIGEFNGKFIVNPTNEQLNESKLDLIYVGNEDKTLMIEGKSNEISEKNFVEALKFAHKAIQPIINAQKQLSKKVGKQKLQFNPLTIDENIFQLCKNMFYKKLQTILTENNKNLQKINSQIYTLKQEAINYIKIKNNNFTNVDENQINIAFDKLQHKIYRTFVLKNNKRYDGRTCDELRKLNSNINIIPKVHGSAMFERQGTQVLSIATLGSKKDIQDIDDLSSKLKYKSFILHYNFPPYSVGEVGKLGFVSRREIGHGALAEKSMQAVLPKYEKFPYAIRIVSEVMESNGSTSMATVCGASLSLIDAGVPIKTPVAGISTGLIHSENNDKYIILSDILGLEDHFGDMDLKIAGTKNGITGFQLDLKINGLSLEILEEAIFINKNKRLEILSHMDATIKNKKNDNNHSYPKFKKIFINPEKIGKLIGPSGKNIKHLISHYNVEIDIINESTGEIIIFSTSLESINDAITEINIMTNDIKVGQEYKGIIKSIKSFGVFIQLAPQKEGLINLSNFHNKTIEDIKKEFKIGNVIKVKCINIYNGKIRLSLINY